MGWTPAIKRKRGYIQLEDTSHVRKATTALGNLSPVAERSTCIFGHCCQIFFFFTCFPAQSFLDFSHFFADDAGNESPLMIILDSGTVVLDEGNMVCPIFCKDGTSTFQLEQDVFTLWWDIRQVFIFTQPNSTVSQQLLQIPTSSLQLRASE